MPNSAGKGKNRLNQMDSCSKPRKQEKLDRGRNTHDVQATRQIWKSMGRDC